MKKLLTILFGVYFIVSWKQYQSNCTCSESSYRFNTIPLIGGYGTVDASDVRPCTISVTETSQRFETEKETDEFIKSLNLQKHLTEEMLDHPHELRWDFKKKKVTEKEEKL